MIGLINLYIEIVGLLFFEYDKFMLISFIFLYGSVLLYINFIVFFFVVVFFIFLNIMLFIFIFDGVFFL